MEQCYPRKISPPRYLPAFHYRNPCTLCRKYCFAQKKSRLERIRPVSVLWTKFPAWPSESIFISDSKHSPPINHIAAARKCNIAPRWSRHVTWSFDCVKRLNISGPLCSRRVHLRLKLNVTPGCSRDFGERETNCNIYVTGNKSDIMRASKSVHKKLWFENDKRWSLQPSKAKVCSVLQGFCSVLGRQLSKQLACYLGRIYHFTARLFICRSNWSS